jgi:hypothetical protein
MKSPSFSTSSQQKSTILTSTTESKTSRDIKLFIQQTDTGKENRNMEDKTRPEPVQSPNLLRNSHQTQVPTLSDPKLIYAIQTFSTSFTYPTLTKPDDFQLIS